MIFSAMERIVFSGAEQPDEEIRRIYECFFPQERNYV